jgi:hypothetical protein
MSDQLDELLLRTEIITGHLNKFVQPYTALVLDGLVQDTAMVPLDILEPACMRARQESTSGFVPMAGEIIRMAIEVRPGERAPGQGQCKPRWYQIGVGRIRAQAERPKEIGRRGEAVDIKTIAGGIKT